MGGGLKKHGGDSAIFSNMGGESPPIPPHVRPLTETLGLAVGCMVDPRGLVCGGLTGWMYG